MLRSPLCARQAIAEPTGRRSLRLPQIGDQGQLRVTAELAALRRASTGAGASSSASFCRKPPFIFQLPTRACRDRRNPRKPRPACLADAEVSPLKTVGLFL